MINLIAVYAISVSIAIIIISIGGCSKLSCLEEKIEKYGERKWKV